MSPPSPEEIAARDAALRAEEEAMKVALAWDAAVASHGEIVQKIIRDVSSSVPENLREHVTVFRYENKWGEEISIPVGTKEKWLVGGGNPTNQRERDPWHTEALRRLPTSANLAMTRALQQALGNPSPGALHLGLAHLPRETLMSLREELSENSAEGWGYQLSLALTALIDGEAAAERMFRCRSFWLRALEGD